MINDTIEVLITLPIANQLIETLQGISPRLHFTINPAKLSKDVADKIWNNAEILYTERVLPDPCLVSKLRWIQFHLAGIEFLLDHPLAKKDIQFTTLSGASSSVLAEYLVMMLLALGHRLPDLMENQRKAEWPHDRFTRFTVQELCGSTVGIVGYGSIGRELARLLSPFNVTLLAAKRDAMHPEDKGYSKEGHGDPGGNLFQRLYPIEALCSMLKECDFVVDTLPLTPQTRDIIGAEELAAMKPTAYLLNVGRGGTINQAALIKSLQEGEIAGAAMDVFGEEPLPSNSPLWKVRNVILTPHVADACSTYDEWAMELFGENIKRYISGSDLFNPFDPGRGY
jgi:phosphoglycerate dehydrogenase-like enzyme